MHGAELAALAEKQRRVLAFEAAVAGGIPIVKTLREGLVGNRIGARLRHPQRHLQLHPDDDARDRPRLRRRAGRGAGAGLRRGRPELRRRRHRRRAQARHPGRRSPSARAVNFAGVQVEGIRHVTLDGHRASPRSSATASSCWASRAQTAGRHRAARASLHGAARRRRSPRSRACSTPSSIEGDFVGQTMFQGRGAGPGRPPRRSSPTSIDVARGAAHAGLRRAGRRARRHARRRRWPRHVGAYYIRLMVQDRPGVIAASPSALRRRARLDRSRCCSAAASTPARRAGRADHA